MATNGSFAVSPSFVLSKTLVKIEDMEIVTFKNEDMNIDWLVRTESHKLRIERSLHIPCRDGCCFELLHTPGTSSPAAWPSGTLTPCWHLLGNVEWHRQGGWCPCSHSHRPRSETCNCASPWLADSLQTQVMNDPGRKHGFKREFQHRSYQTIFSYVTCQSRESVCPQHIYNDQTK